MPGLTTLRGYGTKHQRLRAWWKPRVATGRVPCRRCLELIARGAEWQLGHDDFDRDLPAAPEHKLCNLRAAAAKTNGTLEGLRTFDESEDW